MYSYTTSILLVKVAIKVCNNSYNLCCFFRGRWRTRYVNSLEEKLVIKMQQTPFRKVNIVFIATSTYDKKNLNVTTHDGKTKKNHKVFHTRTLYLVSCYCHPRYFSSTILLIYYIRPL